MRDDVSRECLAVCELSVLGQVLCFSNVAYERPSVDRGLSFCLLERMREHQEPYLRGRRYYHKWLRVMCSVFADTGAYVTAHFL